MKLQSTSFEETIKACLDNRAENDAQFAISYAKENKSIQECCAFIYQEVAKANTSNARCLGFSEEEIVGLAVHYYDEDDIEVTSAPTNVKAVAVPQPKKEPKPAKEKKPRKKAQPKPQVIEEDDDDLTLVIPLF